jgi:catechol 2,3-dioxygenase-like lactoylglutathione lyase family enzyme
MTSSGTHLGLATLVVREYDEAIDFYVNKVGFTLVSDDEMSPTKRWVVVAPPGGGTGLLLAKADGPSQEAVVGNQTGGRVAFFLRAADFDAQYGHMVEHGVEFLEAVRHEPYGKVVVWRDLYGTSWDLLGDSAI